MFVGFEHLQKISGGYLRIFVKIWLWKIFFFFSWGKKKRLKIKYFETQEWSNHLSPSSLSNEMVFQNLKKFFCFGGEGVFLWNFWSRKIWAESWNDHISRNIHQTAKRVESLTKLHLPLTDDIWFRKTKKIFFRSWMEYEVNPMKKNLKNRIS